MRTKWYHNILLFYINYIYYINHMKFHLVDPNIGKQIQRQVSKRLPCCIHPPSSLLILFSRDIRYTSGSYNTLPLTTPPSYVPRFNHPSEAEPHRCDLPNDCHINSITAGVNNSFISLSSLS